MAVSFNSPITIPDGTITNAAVASNAGIEASKLESRSSQRKPVALTSMRVWDAFHTVLPATSAADDLALITGTWGTDTPTLQTSDLKAAGATTRYAAFELEVPHDYQDGQAFQVRLRGGMVTTVADTSATVDLEVYKPDLDGAVGSDLCQTGNATINSLTKANVDFTVLATGIDPGDKLLCRIAVAVNDAATGTAVIAEVSNVEARYTSQG